MTLGTRRYRALLTALVLSALCTPVVGAVHPASAVTSVPPACAVQIVHSTPGAAQSPTEPDLSPDGRYLSYTGYPTSGNYATGIVRFDRSAGTHTRVDVALTGAPNGSSVRSAMTPDGRYIAFYSTSTNLVAGDTNGVADVFVRDLLGGTTARVSVSTGGAQAGAETADRGLAISDDGNVIAFVASTSNLVTGDTNGESDIFVHNRSAGTTTRANVSTSGGQATGRSFHPSMSADGRYVAFAAKAVGLVDSVTTTESYPDIYVRDTVAPSTTMVSQRPDGTRALGEHPSMSADGSLVTYSSWESGSQNVYVRSWQSGPAAPLSITYPGGAYQGPANEPKLSPSGRYVSLQASGSVWAHDRVTGATSLVGIGLDGRRLPSRPGDIADNGEVAYFSAIESWPYFANELRVARMDRPGIEAINPVPVGQQHVPATADQGASDVPITIAGYNLTGAISLDFGDGVTHGPITKSGDRLTTELDIALSATPGEHPLTLANDSGCSTTAATGVRVIDVTPTITEVWPPVAHPGESLTIWIEGTRFGPDSVVTMGEGVTVDDTSFTSASLIAADVTVDPDATLTARPITVTNANGKQTASGPSLMIRSGTGDFHPLPPTRILDSRYGVGGITGKLPAGRTDVQIAGRGGVPATGASAVILNVTVTEPTAASHLSVYPAGVTQPNASNLNFSPGQTVPNLVTVGLGAAGRVSVQNNSGATHVIFDVVGWYGGEGAPGGARFHPLSPSRLTDTRDGTGGPVEGGDWIDVQIAGPGKLPEGRVSAAVVNVTVTGATAPSFLTVWPGDTDLPTASNLNFLPGQTVPNLVTVPVADDGWISVYNAAGTAHVIVDIVGWYDDGTLLEGAALTAVPPARLLDTRYGTGAPVGAIGPLSTTKLQVAGHGGVPATGATAAVLNVTVVEPTAASFLTAGPSNSSRPLASNLNFVPGQTVPNLVVVKLGPDGKINLYNQFGNVHVIADVVGWFG